MVIETFFQRSEKAIAEIDELLPSKHNDVTQLIQNI